VNFIYYIDTLKNVIIISIIAVDRWYRI